MNVDFSSACTIVKGKLSKFFYYYSYFLRSYMHIGIQRCSNNIKRRIAANMVVFVKTCTVSYVVANTHTSGQAVCFAVLFCPVTAVTVKLPVSSESTASEDANSEFRPRRRSSEHFPRVPLRLLVSKVECPCLVCFDNQRSPYLRLWFSGSCGGLSLRSGVV